MCMWIGVGVRWQCIGSEDVWIGGRIGQRWKKNSPDRRWGELGVTGVEPNLRLLRSGGSAFASFRCCVWIVVCFVVVDRHLGLSLIGIWFAGLSLVWIVLSLSRCERSLSLAVFVSVFCCVLAKRVSLFCACYGNHLKVKRLCKMISGLTSVNFGQTEIIFRKIYFS